MWFLKPKLTWHIPEGRDDLTPKKATPGSMAYDLVTPTTEVIKPRSSIIINTLVAATIPKGYALIFGSRSGLAGNNRITVEAGWIDGDYRGMLKVVIYNHGEEEYTFSSGSRIAQAMLVKVNKVNEMTTYKYPDATTTKRGSGGFGSTGK